MYVFQKQLNSDRPQVDSATSGVHLKDDFKKGEARDDHREFLPFIPTSDPLDDPTARCQRHHCLI